MWDSAEETQHGQLSSVMKQLQHVCDHPSLAKGTEMRPSSEDGPNLWESSGKMLVLDKLLKELKEGGSRVLLFSHVFVSLS